jgi:glucosyl-3-phosphoglycerate synthase
MVKVSVIIPAKNEEKTIARVISAVGKQADEIIVVDGHSTDRTREVSEKEGAKVVMQARRMFPGKGNAMKTGLRHATGDIVVFVDADIHNIRPDWISRMTLPIIRGEADVCKAEYIRKPLDAPVTKLVAKPLLRILYPDLRVNMPLEGEISARREDFRRMEFKENWGVDVGLVLSAHRLGLRIKNVHLGKKFHKPSYVEDIAELSPMAEDILRAILEESGVRF